MMMKFIGKACLCAALIMMMGSCSTKQAPVPAPLAEELSWVEADHSFVKADADSIPTKIVSAEEFRRYFGMAPVMGPNGKPTEIDFGRQFVVAYTVVPSDREIALKPKSVTRTNGIVSVVVDIEQGQPLTYMMRPLLLLVLDRKYASDQVVVETE